MTRHAVILDAAKGDFREIKKYVKQHLIVHMFIHTKKDFQTHLSNRLLAPIFD